MKNKKNLMFLFCLVLVFAAFATGCRPLERPDPTPAPDQNQQTELRETTPGADTPEGNQQPNNDMTGVGDLSSRADTIADAVTDLPEVDSATVLITDNTAIVGITTMDDTMGDNNVGQNLQNDVERVVREADREIDRVSVTTDPDLFTRIENIANETGQGRPLSGFGTEIEEILRRITPTNPAN
ncbi:YhcN/YlaJ family sporulation lipoprotein [Serpentinicella sp. ANB-PHB4]|uniref:YhcN/YlaJ family sporulation lipoprotein n=1 Tax=Serpentinicella sp. ANB-PHB4 TaxID=3074076 RepID=UPI0028675DA8|nr:YhcN/YlaJ family sporulation lipoprotein [Serpentinicella sp. ANB-PHB4]MDR5658020.1 YhcN/YlaJ family sporulation lipoprotein [Serpentinicella sp. ANB-PHB4]